MATVVILAAGIGSRYDEWLLPDVIDSMICNDNINVQVIENNARCIGITNESDTEKVRKYFRDFY